MAVMNRSVSVAFTLGRNTMPLNSKFSATTTNNATTIPLLLLLLLLSPVPLCQAVFPECFKLKTYLKYNSWKS
jgi:hypothetical protein